MKGLGEELPEAIELMTGSAKTILDRWFESDHLKGTLATDAIIGAFQPYSAPGSAYVLLHHVMGEAGGARGVWAYVEGGMGALSEAMAASAREKGVEIRLDAAIEKIEVSGGCVTGVRLSSGETIEARRVASGVDAHWTFEKMLDQQHLPEAFRRAVSRIDYSSASLKVNLAVSELPDFTCLPGKEQPGPQHRGTIHIGATPEYLERAYDDAKYGRPSQRPVVEMTIPTSVDKTLAPEGHHILSLFVQYAPYPTGRRKLGRHQGRICRSLPCRDRALRAECSRFRFAPTGFDAGRPRANLWTDGGEHHAGRDVAEPIGADETHRWVE